MAYAKCTNCGRVMRWKARRGSVLAAITCQCGGALKQSKWLEYQAQEIAAGRRCSECGMDTEWGHLQTCSHDVKAKVGARS
jgi:endogenous inhibitor of DNA gyrase (YacG/DUF329 family)